MPFPGRHSFASFRWQPLAESSSNYLFITTDVASGITSNDGTIGVKAPSMQDLTFEVGLGTGALSDGDVQRIDATKRVYVPVVQR